MTRTRTLAAAAAAGAAGLGVRARSSKGSGAHVAAPPPLVGRQRTVLAEDGVELAVTEYGAGSPAVTVLLAHGYVQSSALWSGQVRDLVEARPDLRVVTYDHRGHGASGRTTLESSNLEQLGRDLERVLDAVAPSGPVVLAGHSLGGMTIMALAEQAPELFGSRVLGAAFVATSGGGLDAVTYGLPAPVAAVAKKVLPRLNAKAVRDELAGKPRKVAPPEIWTIFGRGADPALVRATREVHSGTRAETVAWFLPTFATHDRLEVLKALNDLPSVVIVGAKDLLCPLPHSQALAAALRGSELVVYPGVGHMVQLERRAEVSSQLLRLLERAVVA